MLITLILLLDGSINEKFELKGLRVNDNNAKDNGRMTKFRNQANQRVIQVPD